MFTKIRSSPRLAARFSALRCMDGGFPCFLREGTKNCPILPLPAMATLCEIIYKTCNHASGRRELHPCAEHAVVFINFTCGQRKWPYPHPDVHQVHRRSHDCGGYQKRGPSWLNLLTVSNVVPRSA